MEFLKCELKENNLMIHTLLTKPPKVPHQENIKRWKPNTCLVVGDSTRSGIQENRLSINQLFKVRVLPRAYVSDCYHYPEPLMEKCPRKLNIHAGTNVPWIKNPVKY